MDALVEAFPEKQQPELEGIRFAVIGRPNVGKSSLVNALLKEERVIVSDIEGTTRDAIDTPFEQDGVALKDVVTLEEAPRMGCGVMELDHTSFEWTLTYDEYDLVLDGTLEIEIDGRVVSGGPGDIIYIPKGSHIHFQTPNRTRYAYFVYPADWQ